MPERRLLIIRLGSLGDIIHTLPAAAALRDTFPGVQLDWVVAERWLPLLQDNPDLNHVIPFNRSSTADVVRVVERLRDAKYTLALDFQSLYKSALLALSAGADEVLGFDWKYAREGGASLLYTRQIHPAGAHKVEHNLSLAEAAGAKLGTPRFWLPRSPEADKAVADDLADRGIPEFYVINPGGGWRSKCWPAERFGELYRELASRCGLQGVVSYGPGEDVLAKDVVRAAGVPAPVPLGLDLLQLIALLRRAKFVVAADTGPLHLAAALGTPVVGLYGPTDPVRNGPYGTHAVVIRKTQPEETTYKRGASHSAAMMRIDVADVISAIASLGERS